MLLDVAPPLDQVADAIIVIAVFIAALITRWEQRKTREKIETNGTKPTTRE